MRIINVGLFLFALWMVPCCVTPESSKVKSGSEMKKTGKKPASLPKTEEGKSHKDRAVDESKVDTFEKEKEELRRFQKSELTPYKVSDRTCLKLAEIGPRETPVKGAYIAEFQDTCLTLDGERGVLRNSDYSLMLIPGVYTPGRIEIKATIYNPKVVLMHLSGSSSLSQQDERAIEREVSQNYQYSAPKAPVVTNPFMLQLWRLEDFGMMGEGASIVWVVSEQQLNTWHKFRTGKKELKVTLWGRESTWQETPLLKINGILTSKDGIFVSLNIERIQVINDHERQQDLSLCTKNINAMNCQKLFSSR